jgi:hypothetical protein
MPTLLSCYSTGDTRFSARFATLYAGRGERWTIEQLYQWSKRDEQGRQYTHPKGRWPAYLLLAGRLHPCTNELRHTYYTSLWHLYFKERPHLFEYACTFDGFYEREGSPVFWIEEGKTFGAHLPSPFASARSANQALSIAYLVYHRRISRYLLFPPEVIEAVETYWVRFHPGVACGEVWQL